MRGQAFAPFRYSKGLCSCAECLGFTKIDQASQHQHMCREAFLNSQLAASWRHGEAWAALDYYGLELGETAAARHQANCRQVAPNPQQRSHPSASDCWKVLGPAQLNVAAETSWHPCAAGGAGEGGQWGCSSARARGAAGAGVAAAKGHAAAIRLRTCRGTISARHGHL